MKYSRFIASSFVRLKKGLQPIVIIIREIVALFVRQKRDLKRMSTSEIAPLFVRQKEGLKAIVIAIPKTAPLFLR